MLYRVFLNHVTSYSLSVPVLIEMSAARIFNQITAVYIEIFYVLDFTKEWFIWYLCKT